MSWLYETRGAEDHWLLELYDRLNLPVLEGMLESCLEGNESRMKNLQQQKTQKFKDLRVSYKVRKHLILYICTSVYLMFSEV